MQKLKDSLKKRHDKNKILSMRHETFQKFEIYCVQDEPKIEV